MTARTPEDLLVLFEERVNEGDLDGLLDLYEPEAVMVPGRRQAPVKGTKAIREVLQGYLKLRPTIIIDTVNVTRTRKFALLRTHWQLSGIDDKGQYVATAGDGEVVARRQPDGTWRVVNDKRFGDAGAGQ